MENKYLLSIVIPTKNRQQYLLESVKQIRSIAGEEIQIVIQDNSDNDSLAHEKLIVSDVNIKYNYVEGVVSFVDNFSIGVSLAEGDYLCVIGDDDGITSQIVDITRWALHNNIDSVIPSIQFEYFWPNSIKLYDFEANGIIRLLESDVKVRKMNSKKAVIDLLNNGCQDYAYFDLVKLYHGIIKKSCLDRVKEITGHYFGGLSPDIYISVALSLICEKNVGISYPLTIAGVCARSGSADSTNGKHTGKFEDAPHLKGHDSYNWSPLVPKFYSVETIWADSALAAVTEMKCENLITEFNDGPLNAICQMKYHNYELLIKDNQKLTEKKSKRITRAISNKFYIFIYYIKKIIRKLKRYHSKLILKDNISDIHEAYDYFNDNYGVLRDLKKQLDDGLSKIIKSLNGR